MKREFVITCTNKNYDTIKNIVTGFLQNNGFLRKNMTEENVEHYYTRIQFKCTKKRLTECRNTLRDLVNAGLLLSTTEIW